MRNPSLHHAPVVVTEPLLKEDTVEHFHATPVHTGPNHSPLSKEAPPQNYRGFIHLSTILLGLSLLQTVIENYKKYGLLIFPSPFLQVSFTEFVCAIIIYSDLLLHLFIAWLLEKSTIAPGFCMNLLFPLASINIFASLAIPIYLVWNYVDYLYLGTVLTLLSMVMSMKLTSYHLVNYDLRRSPLYYKECPYPQNITLGNILYFWFAPTLSYQPVYPRTESIRWMFVLTRFLEGLGSGIMMHFIVRQYAYPTVVNAFDPLQNMDIVGIAERVIKLSVSSVHIWILMFFSMFHCLLNILAELTRFSDRLFYLPWWNASNMQEFWRLWNVPVYAWLRRHVYLPLRLNGRSPFVSSMATFFLSAVFHEIGVGVPTHVLQSWAFWGMLLQVPLIWMTKGWMNRSSRSSLGNYLFWFCICVFGQPVCVLLYYRAWAMKQPPTQVFWL